MVGYSWVVEATTTQLTLTDTWIRQHRIPSPSVC